MTTLHRWVAGAVLAAHIAGFAALPASAGPLADDIIPADRLLIASGNARQAMPSLEHAAVAEPDDPEIWFLLGMARRLSGDETGAADAFRTCTDLAPTQPRALLELGQSLTELRQFDAAYDAFNRALLLVDNRVVRRKIRRYLTLLDQKRVLTLSLGTTAQPDSNANTASGQRVVTIDGIPFLLNTPNKPNGSLGLGVEANLRYAPYLTDEIRLVNEASFTGVNFFHTCCSDDSVTFASGPGWWSEGYHALAQAYARRRYYDGLPYTEERGGHVETGLDRQDYSLTLGAEGGSSRLLGPHVPGTVARGFTGGDVTLWLGVSAGMTLRVEADDYSIPSQSFTSGSIETRLSFDGPWALPMRVWGIALNRAYDGATLTSNGKRFDRLWGGGWMVDLDFITFWGMSPRIGVTYLHQQSNDSLGRFDRMSGIFGISKGF